MLLHILHLPGIVNIVSLQPLFESILVQLGDPSVPYRRLVRECLRRLNTTCKQILESYNKQLNELDRSEADGDWIFTYELLGLVMHWMEVSQPA